MSIGSFAPSQGINLTKNQALSLRIWGHDINDDGRNNGSVLLKTIFNPVGSGNEAFIKDDVSKQAIQNHLFADFADDRTINGSSIRRDFGQIYRQVTGVDISRQLASAPLQAAPLSWQEIMRKAPDMRTQQGLIQMGQETGLGVLGLLNASLWGHDARDAAAAGGRTINGSIFPAAINDPKSIDFGFVNAFPQTKSYTQGLINRDQQQSGRITGNALETDFRRVLGAVYGQQF